MSEIIDTMELLINEAVESVDVSDEQAMAAGIYIR